ncbi:MULTISPECIES: dihydrodipicolinate synthase family protein [Streptomyces]|uniref:dihydrodipicolinate synthase family protein n=1 Tax=Streptomyces TaxID=1883 RepID=UPI00103E62FA|nr:MULTISPECIES: dihydrodipicolinate synthase family protein [Streptomyces]MBT3073044.1 dihydrodipicolinate synthase family protein [Streptomyces sp. COG21]MBT3081451.1 dihydrodipicolinate synthase family protein [Streptomyces sp. COG20]MBT3089615.1 dihydrodipicolinate synthase family protein [Streptomyces sp. CYG21]MBT3096495.1 dihydrodipicolinate synthase family protein [Streptomyces sp. CBG30]MBT3103038.1 dihydrodipicolinate synthase family protein [Streptomyces sp. COG19]
MQRTYTGTIVPLITPLDPTGTVDGKSVGRLVDHIRTEVTGLMPALTSGEGWKLDARQWHDMVAHTVSHAQGLPVLAGIQLPGTEAVVERALLAARLGVDAVVVTTPFGKDVGQDAIVEHYKALRAASDIPLFLYNEEALSGNRIEYDTLLRICSEIPGVVGIKESSGDPAFTRRMASAGTDVPVFEGWENLLVDAAGIDGFIGPLANLEPALCNAMLVDPTPDRQSEINAVCKRYGVFEDDWYRWVKKELHTRGVIDSPLTHDEAAAS